MDISFPVAPFHEHAGTRARGARRELDGRDVGESQMNPVAGFHMYGEIPPLAPHARDVFGGYRFCHRLPDLPIDSRAGRCGLRAPHVADD